MLLFTGDLGEVDAEVSVSD